LFGEGGSADQVLATIASRGLRRPSARWNAYINCGPHDVRARATTHGVTLEFRTSAVTAAPQPAAGLPNYRTFRVRQNSRGFHTVRVSRWNADAVRTLLEWVARHPAAPITGTRPAASTQHAARSLGNRRKFGIEIEFYGADRDTVWAAVRAAGLEIRSGGGHSMTDWTLKSDCSIHNTGGTDGLELVSPPLSGDDGIEQVRKALAALASVGARINRTCGLHVHHEARDLGANGIARLVRSWFEHQRLIDWLVQPSRRGDADNTYCHAWRENLVVAVEQAARRGEVFTGAGRYTALNLCSFPAYGTVEVRQHGGTLDFIKIEAWIKLGQALFDAVAQSPGAALTPAGGLRGMLRSLPGLDDNTRAYLVGRAVEFGATQEAIGYAEAVAA